MKKIMQLVSPLPLPEESDPEIAIPENIQQIKQIQIFHRKKDWRLQSMVYFWRFYK